MTAKVAISSDFLTAFARLPRQVQGKVTEFVNKFRNDPTSPGIHYEKLRSGIDRKIYSVRIDDTYRGIVVRQDDVYLLLWIDHHDEAYQWAARKRCEINPQTGSLQVFDVQTATVTVPPKAGLFAACREEDLLRLGVPEAQLPYVYSLTNQQQFQQASASVPSDAYEYLSWLAEGFSVEEVLSLFAEEHPVVSPSEDFSAALEQPASLKSFVVIDGEDELRRIMAEPLEKWRVFLHPTQRRIVERSYSGPVRVLGGAGTGKTVVAMHRARYLAAQCTDDQRILFTTFTANLAADIQDNLRKICSPEELCKIEVLHLDAWVNHFLKDSGFSFQIIYDADLTSLWEKALLLADPELPYDISFYQEEWNRVIIAQEAITREKYLKAARNGRGVRLDRKKRLQVWQVMECYQNLMKESQLRDINTAMYECAKLLQASTVKPQYQHILVDEGQDFSDNAYRLIRSLAGDEHPDDIFIVGDTHQRIYHNHPVLSRCGIHVRGRSSILRINYRTTEETRRAALSVLNGLSFDDMDDGMDTNSQCQSLTHGEAPLVQNFADADAEFRFVCSEIKKLLRADVAINDICIVARTKNIANDYLALLMQAGIRSYAIKRNKAEDRGMDGVRVATMHRVKGLEFKYVFLVAVNDRIVPLSSALNHNDPISETESITSERSLLYVAMTRAQKAVYITSYGACSPFLK